MMSLETFLLPQQAAFDSSILDHRHGKALSKLTSTLPGAFAYAGVGFESTLSDPKPSLDLLLAVNSASQGRTLLPTLSATSAHPEHRAWQIVTAFSRRWSTPEDILHNNLDDLWLEFDITADGTPLPALFACPSKHQNGRKQTREELLAIINEYLAVMLDKTAHAKLADNLTHALQALPTHAIVFQVGVMLSRASQYVRLCICDIPVNCIAPYLTQMGYVDANTLGELALWASQWTNPIAIALDIGPDIHPKIGLECYIGENRKTEAATLWRDMLNALVALDASREDKVNAILSFPGYHEVDVGDTRWPPQHLQMLSIFGKMRRSVFVRSLHHIKLVHQPGQRLQTKAYLGMIHRWLG